MDRNKDNFNQRIPNLATKHKVHAFDAKLNSSKVSALLTYGCHFRIIPDLFVFVSFFDFRFT